MRLPRIQDGVTGRLRSTPLAAPSQQVLEVLVLAAGLSAKPRLMARVISANFDQKVRRRHCARPRGQAEGLAEDLHGALKFDLPERHDEDLGERCVWSEVSLQEPRVLVFHLAVRSLVRQSAPSRLWAGLGRLLTRSFNRPEDSTLMNSVSNQKTQPINPNWPSKTGNPSGGGRGNGTPKGK